MIERIRASNIFFEYVACFVRLHHPVGKIIFVNFVIKVNVQKRIQFFFVLIVICLFFIKLKIKEKFSQPKTKQNKCYRQAKQKLEKLLKKQSDEGE